MSRSWKPYALNRHLSFETRCTSLWCSSYFLLQPLRLWRFGCLLGQFLVYSCGQQYHLRYPWNRNMLKLNWVSSWEMQRRCLYVPILFWAGRWIVRSLLGYYHIQPREHHHLWHSSRPSIHSTEAHLLYIKRWNHHKCFISQRNNLKYWLINII